MDPKLNTVDQAGAERRRHPRFQMLARVNITTADDGETYWGNVCDVSRTGVAIYIRQRLGVNQNVPVRFHFFSADGQEVTEELPAKTVWQSTDAAGLQFDQFLVAGSPALEKAPCLAAYLAKKESEG